MFLCSNSRINVWRHQHHINAHTNKHTLIQQQTMGKISIQCYCNVATKRKNPTTSQIVTNESVMEVSMQCLTIDRNHISMDVLIHVSYLCGIWGKHTQTDTWWYTTHQHQYRWPPLWWCWWWLRNCKHHQQKWKLHVNLFHDVIVTPLPLPH